MVSSGISGNITSVRAVESLIGAAGRNPDADFGSIMTQSMTQSAAGNDDPTSGTNDSPNVESARFMTEAASGKGQAQKDKLQKAGETAGKTEDTDTQDVKDKLKDDPKLKETVEQIREKIKDEFEVTDEDIENALEALGFTMVDLLDEGNLTDFVVELTGMESQVDLLVSSELSAKTGELFEFINTAAENLMKDFEVSEDDLKELLKEIDVKRDAKEPEIKLFNESEEAAAKNPVVEKNDNREPDRRLSDNGNPEKNLAAENTSQPEIKVVKSSTQEFHSGEHRDFSNEAGSNEMAGSIVNNLTNAVNEAFELNVPDKAIDPVQIIEQIVESAKIVLNQETTSMELMLNPENLGRVNLNVSVKAGVVTASIVAQNEAVKEAIESQIVLLKNNLSSQGIKVEAVEVTVESHAFNTGAGQEQGSAFNEQKEAAQKRSSRPLRLDSLEDLVQEDLTEEEKIVLDMMAEEGRQVNFTA